jgi:hypothetical protein
MEFNRFDIAEAYYCVEVDYNVSGWLQERPSNQRRKEATHIQLWRMRFRPRLNLSYETLTENGQMIYDAQVEKLKL